MLYLFKPKHAIESLFSNRLNKKLILFLILIIFANAVLFFFGFGEGYINDLIVVIKEKLGSLNDIGIKRALGIIRDLSIMLLLYILISTIIMVVIIVIFNLIIKKILKLFKKEISLWKLINIAIYSILFHYFLGFIWSAILNILYFFADKSPESQIYYFILYPGIIINILTVIIYVYGVKISIKNILSSKNTLSEASFNM